WAAGIGVEGSDWHTGAEWRPQIRELRPGARVANVAAMSAIASLLVGVAVVFAACSGSDSRPVTPKSLVAESAPVSVPVAAKRPEPGGEQLFAPGLPPPSFAQPDRRAKPPTARPGPHTAPRQQPR